ncbi:unnamed protein product [Amoebophrya sp. A25]|nr:unnamed protein product [Amoebophrya sp. A25]|eukprot:GSA25T00019644001.1
MSSVIGKFRMFVPAATAKPSPAIGQALGPLGINMMNFTKDFNTRTSRVRPEVPLQVTLFPKTDKSFRYLIRSPSTKWFLHRVARLPMAAPVGFGNITLKELYHIAEAKSQDPQWIGVPLRTICLAVLGTCKGMGIRVTRERLQEFSKRDEVRVWDLEKLRKELRTRKKNKARGAAKKK